MKLNKLIAIVGILVLSVALFAGCQDTTTPPDGGEDDGGDNGEVALDDDQYINNYISSDPTTLDPSLRSDTYSSTILVNTLEGLVRMEQKDGEYQLNRGDAEKWDTNDDGTVWTFTLGDNKWEDGEPVTAQNYVYSLRRSCLPETGSPNSYFLKPIKNFEKINNGEMDVEELGVKAIDEKTLEITLNEPVPAFLSMIDATVYYPQREDKIEEWGEQYGSEAQYTISNGPFKVDSWTHNSSIVLTKNDNYWAADDVHLDKVNYAIMTDETTYYTAFESGDVDFVTTGKTEWLDKFKQEENTTYNTYTSATITYNFYNNKDELFKNENIRKAFTLALDREDMNEICFDGLRVPTYGWVVPTMSVGDTNYRDAAGNLITEMKDELAEQDETTKDLLLKGMEELGLGDDPSTLDVTFYFGGTSDWHKTVGEYLQQVYKEALGVELKIDFAEWGIFYSDVQQGNYQVGLMTWGAYYNDPYDVLSLFMSQFDMIETGWSNEEFDQLISEAAVEMDTEARLQKYIEAEKILIKDECVVCPLATNGVHQFVRDYVHGYSTLGFSNMGMKRVYTAGR